MRRTFCFLATVLALSSTESLHAAPARFLRTPDISPDGKLVAFSYLGDIWVVDAAGGTARHLSMHERHDINPIFSPDGKKIAFSSNRHGGYDVFVVPVEGGRPTRLTHDSAEDHPTAWSPDGRHILFASNRGADYPSRVELYRVPVTGGLAQRVSAYEGREGSYSPAGDLIAYVRGPGSWYRRGYRGSSNDDLWLSSADGTNNRLITRFVGQDNAPMWSADGKSLFYVSEYHGAANIVRQDLETDRPDLTVAPPVQITFHKDESVGKARISRGGNAIVYECGADLCIVSLKEGKSRKLAIDVHADDKTNFEKLETFSAKATEYAISHDEKHIAFVVHGEIFLMPRNGGKARRLTEHPAADHGIAWAPDSRRILFLSDRGGYEDIWALEADDPDHPELVQAHRFKVKQLSNTPETELGLSFAPDGKRIAFLRAGRLVTANPDGGGEKVIVDGQVFDYEWSPDSQWLCFARTDASFASELYIVPAAGPTAADPVRNVTRFATYNGGVTWSKTGNRLAFISQRKKSANSAFVMALQKPSVPGAPAVRGIDWEGIHVRVRQPASMTISECAISNDGAKIAFRANQDGDDLWVANVDGGQVTRITTGNQKPTQIQWSRFFGGQIFFRDAAGNIKTATQSGISGSTAVAAIPFQARMTVRQDELFQEIFEQSWRALNDSFYDSAFHGADWAKVRAKYRALVSHCVLKEDLYSLLFLMLGELNASHLGISGNLGAAEQATADLGLLFDDAYRGPGLKIAEILQGGPADRHGLNLKRGDVLLSIDRADIDDKTDLARLLNDKAGETVALHVASNPDDPRSKRRVEVQGAARPAIAGLMYERWTARNARRVADLSKGKLGYIHIPDMQENGLDRFLRQLYSDNFDKDGLVLDVRFNSGGYTHETILNYLLGKEHTLFSQRGGAQGFVLNQGDRKWTRPLVCLINNRSYSDAEIFPHAFRAHGLGKLVGQPTGAHVIGTRNITLIDGSSFRTPRIGVRTFKGINMEKEGVTPDVIVDAHPDAWAKGEDGQLDRAVEVLQQDVELWRKSRSPVAGQPRATPPGSSSIEGPMRP